MARRILDQPPQRSRSNVVDLQDLVAEVVSAGHPQAALDPEMKPLRRASLGPWPWTTDNDCIEHVWALQGVTLGMDGATLDYRCQSCAAFLAEQPRTGAPTRESNSRA